MSTNGPNVAVAVYEQHTEAENAVKALQRAGFDMKKMANKFMLVLHGDKQEISLAQELLKSSGLYSFDHHAAQREAHGLAHA